MTPGPETKPRLLTRILRKTLRWCILFGLHKLAIIALMIAALTLIFSALESPLRQAVAVLLLTGLWTATCIMLGQYLSYKRHIGASPLPDIDADQAITALVQQLTLPKKPKQPARDGFKL